MDLILTGIRFRGLDAVLCPALRAPPIHTCFAMSRLAQALAFRGVRHGCLRAGMVLVAAGLVIRGWPDVLLPAFLAVWQGVALGLELRKAAQARRDAEG